MNEKITFTQEPSGGYIGVCSPSIDRLVVDGQPMVVTKGMLAVKEVPKEILAVTSKYNRDKLLHYADINNRSNIITVEKAQEIAGLGGTLGDDYYPVYAPEMVYRRVFIEVRQPMPEPSIPFITVHEATPRQQHTAQYDEEGHLRHLLNEAWGDGAISSFHYHAGQYWTVFFNGGVQTIKQHASRALVGSLDEIERQAQANVTFIKAHHAKWSRLMFERVTNMAYVVNNLESILGDVRALPIRNGTANRDKHYAAIRQLKAFIDELVTYGRKAD